MLHANNMQQEFEVFMFYTSFSDFTLPHQPFFFAKKRNYKISKIM
jgi:hypothetical protein